MLCPQSVLSIFYGCTLTEWLFCIIGRVKKRCGQLQLYNSDSCIQACFSSASFCSRGTLCWFRPCRPGVFFFNKSDQDAFSQNNRFMTIFAPPALWARQKYSNQDEHSCLKVKVLKIFFSRWQEIKTHCRSLHRCREQTFWLSGNSTGTISNVNVCHEFWQIRYSRKCLSIGRIQQ